MNWVSEREEWLAEWGDARRLKEISFLAAGAAAPRPAQDDSQDVFFSEVIETCGRSLVCRAAGAVVDVFDISPSAESLVSWRVLLPDVVVRDIGISASCVPGEPTLSIVFLTKAVSVHAIDISLAGPVPELRAGASAPCRCAATPSAFCALGAALVALGGRDGSLRVVNLRAGVVEGGCELSDASLLKRIAQGLTRNAGPPVLALAAAGAGAGQGMCLLSYTADGRIGLWEASERHGRLLASASVPGGTGGGGDTAVGGAGQAVRLVVGAAQAKACLVLPSRAILIELPADRRLDGSGALATREVRPPFVGAAPRLVTLSQGSLWGLWCGRGREQLYRLALEEPDVLAWERGALDASLIRVEDANASPALRRAATEGCCSGSCLATATGEEEERAAHRSVLTLFQQEEVWRGEEDGFDATRTAAPPQVAGSSEKVTDQAIRWWAGRALLPGRFPRAAVVTALQDGSSWGGERRRSSLGSLNGGASAGERHAGDLRAAVEEHLRRHAGILGTSSASSAASSSLAAAIGAAGAEFVRRCVTAAQRGRQVCALGVSVAWAPHAWRPAGDVLGAGAEGGLSACPVVLYSGGVSCIRAVHHWSERWWATCHLFRDMANYAKVDIEHLLGLSTLVEWKVCVTGWFLAQCVGSANIGLAICSMPHGASSSSVVQDFVQDIPENLIKHVKKCGQWLESPSLATETETLRQLLQYTCSPEQWKVSVLGHSLDALGGTWSAGAVPQGGPGLRLSDMLRGGIAASEGENTCALLRDLSLLGAYVAREAPGVCPLVWRAMTEQLDRHLPLYAAVHRSMGMHIASAGAFPGPLARASDLWAAHFRAAVAGRDVVVRAPLASMRALQYALLLMRHESWEALREWCKHQEMAAFSSYVAAREWLVGGLLDAARLGFEQAEGAAELLVQCLRSGGQEVADGPPPAVAYLQHVAGLYAARGLADDEGRFLRRAAEAAAPGDGPLRQRLWTAVFERAVQSDMLEDACDVLVSLEHFEGHLHALAQKMRSSGRVDLMLRLPDKHRSRFINNLHEHALLSSPTPGSDSLLCYNHLYALHFSAQEYLKAASIAFTLYTALGHMLQSVAVEQAPGGDAGYMANTQPWTGDCISKPSEVPSCTGGTGGAMTVAVEGVRGADAASASAWPILEQQRSGLLMLLSALSLTSERILLAPPPQGATAPMAVDSASTGGSLESAASTWLAGVEICGGNLRVVSLKDVEQLLAVVEARLVLCGDGGAGVAPATTKLDSPASAARRVAELGLLGLALRVAAAHGLDPWQSALQPFLALCFEADAQSPEKTALVADAARGPAQALMFVRSDGSEALGAGGDAARGWWQALEHALKASGDGKEGSVDASRRRLYSLAAEELLTRRPKESLPEFLTKVLSDGPSWVSLLRLFMKHGRLEDAVDLLTEQVQRCEGAARLKVLGSERKWTPLQDFPVSLVVQLQRAVVAAKAKDGGSAADRSKASACASELERNLAKFGRLLEDAERARDSRH